MDPQAAWIELAECFTSPDSVDWERVSELADGLLHWVKRGGYPPSITGYREFDKIISLRSLEAIVDWHVGV